MRLVTSKVERLNNGIARTGPQIGPLTFQSAAISAAIQSMIARLAIKERCTLCFSRVVYALVAYAAEAPTRKNACPVS